MEKITRDVWIGLGTAAALTAAALAVYLPQGRKLGELRTKMATLQGSLEADSQKVAVVPSLLRQIESLKGQYKDWDHRLPPHKELGGFLAEISHNLSDGNLSDPEIVPGNPIAEDLYHTLPIVMRCRGSYLELASFLADIGRMQRLTRVHTLKIDTDSKDPRLKIEMQLNIYFAQT